MERKGFVALLFLMLCLMQNFASAQNISNEGTEFWAVFPSHDPSDNRAGSLANVKIYVNSRTGSEVTISCGSYQIPATVIPANTPVGFVIPRPAAYIDAMESGRPLSNRGIRIQVTPGRGKVSVYQHIYAGARSAASLILPVAALGQTYFSMNYTQQSSRPGVNENFIALVATEANTSLRIHTKEGIIPVQLDNPGEVYQYLGSDKADLTGLMIDVDPNSSGSCTKRFAAFSGSTGLSIGCSGSVDPLFQQLYPIGSWGKEYGIVPFEGRSHIIRVVAQEDQTTVRIGGDLISLKQGEFYESDVSSVASFVSADKKVSVAQYALTQTCSGANLGDPEMLLLNPIEFNIKDVTMFSSSDQAISEKYINVLMKTSKTSTLRFNGNPVPGSWSLISGTDYSYIQIGTNLLGNVLSADDGFNATAYGFGSFESYGYSAGTNLATNNFLLVSNTLTNRDAASACLGQPSDFKLVLPVEANSITWQLDNGPPEFIQSPTAVHKTLADGSYAFEYTYEAGVIFNQIASHKMTLTVELATGNTCLGNNETYVYDFNVDPVPIADFDSGNTNFCGPGVVNFSDFSDALNNTRTINKWQWDFGDGSPVSTDRNPVHQYARSGDYIVKLSAGIDDGCMSDVLEKKVVITINPAPVVVFNAVPAVCVSDEAVQLNQATQTIAGVNGTGVFSGPGISTNGLFDPAIAGPGVHQITYTFTGTGGCVDTKTQNIIVTPEPNLKIPTEINILEGGEFRMKVVDASVDSRYEWTVADGFLSNSNILNPVIQAGEKDRQYKLTVTTAGGCTAEYLLNVVIQNNLKPSNTFSPNDDGVNDYWVIKYIETYPNTTVQIFNRLGERVFFSNNYNQPFDGRHNGKALPVGTYYYIIEPKNGRPRLTGSLTIIR